MTSQENICWLLKVEIQVSLASFDSCSGMMSSKQNMEEGTHHRLMSNKPNNMDRGIIGYCYSSRKINILSSLIIM